MKRSVGPFLVVGLAIVALGVVAAGALLAHNFSVRSLSQGDVVQVPALPTPGTSRTTYVTSAFGYRFQYPTQWHLVVSKDGSLARLFMVYEIGSPEAEALEVTCAANPSQLDAHTWWQQGQPQQGEEQGVGTISLTSGTPAYVARGQGQTPYTVYTVVQGRTACQVVAFQTDAHNAQIILTTVNSFTWQ